MTTKRFILMMLVALGSVTGAWAELVGTGYTIVNSQFSLISGVNGEYYKSNNSQANMVIKADHEIFLAEVYILADLFTSTAGYPNKIKIEGSNDQSAWTTIKENSLSQMGNTVSVSASDKYQYFRLTFYTSQYNSIGFSKLTISEDIIDGEGTTQNPYTLNKICHLKQYSELIAEGNNAAYAKLTTNLDMGQTTFASIDNANYVGTIDGNGYSIKNLNNVSGLFKSIGAATIKNLTIENATLSATDAYSGAFAAQANGTIFQNCTVKGTISASSTYAGGLVGDAIGCTFTDCKVSGINVTGTTAGGLVGNANGTSFTNCLVLSDFTAVGCTTVGGLAGNAAGATFTRCYSIGNISVEGNNCGGLVGMASGNTKLTQCYSATGMDNEIRPTYVSTETTGHYENLDASMLVDETGTTNEWCTPTSAKVNGVWNIVVTTGHPAILKSIKLWNARNTANFSGRTWKKVKVYGSNTANGPWGEPIGDFDNLDLAINNYGYAGELAIDATQVYTYYKIDILDNKGDDYMQMSDMKFIVSSQHHEQLPVCGSTDGSCTAIHCYHLGNASSALSTSVEQADVASGRLAYLLNNGDYKGPYFQRIGTDTYPHFTSTGDGYVYLALDDATYTNDCPHRDCTKIPFKAPTCVGASGNVEYNQCKNSFCKCLLTSNRDVVSNVKEFTLSNKAVNIQEHVWGTAGAWNFSESKKKNNTTYYNVMQVNHIRTQSNDGDYVISYTSVDDDPTMNLHLFFTTNIGVGSFSVRFYVNGIERPTSQIIYPNNTSELHDIVSIDGLHKYDMIKVVYHYGHTWGNTNNSANLFIGTEKELPKSHDLKKYDFHYNCIDGGCKEHYECSRCTNVFTQNTPTSDAGITTLSAVTLAPVGSHNFVEKHLEGNLYGMQCQNTYCTTFDPDKYVLKNYHNDTDLTLTYDGSTYSTTNSLSLVDGKSYVTPVAFDAPSLTYSRTFYTNVWNPWFVPFTATVEELADNGVTDVACIESIHNYDTDDDGVVDKTVLEVIKKTSGTMKAGVPYMVKTGESYTYPMAFTDRVMDASTNAKTLHSETISAAYDFIGTYSGLIAADLASSNHYSLNEEGKMVHRTLNILPQRWYMKEVGKENVYEELSPAMARAFAIRVIGEEDETTGIRTIYPEDGQKEERLPEGIFDLNGRKLSAPQSGQINIINGKKHFVR